jgi:hypothetical protein
MSKIDTAAIRKIVRAMAAKESVDRRIVADLLIQIGIIPIPTSLKNMKMDLLPFKFSLGEVFRGDFDCHLSSRLRELFPGGLSNISDRLEASWRTERIMTEGNQNVKARESSPEGPTTIKRTMVEECFVIDVEQLDQWGILLPHYPRFGFMLLFKTLTGAPLLCMWEINRSESLSRLGLTYVAPGSEKVVSSLVELWHSETFDKTKHQRYWMKCSHENEQARLPYRRLLYLPPGAEIFKCGQCYNLERHRSRSMEGLDLSVPFFFLPPQR